MRHISLRLSYILVFFSLSTLLFSQGGYNLPSNFYEVGCVFKTESFDMSIVERVRSQETNVSTYFSAVVGDLDGDGFGEIVIPGGTHGASEYVFIFNHKAELVKQITLPADARMDYNYDSVLLIDFDNDGKVEIVVSSSKGKKLLIYDYQGNLITTANIPTVFPKTIGVADFNNDGFPELYVGTRIYNFKNGILTLLVDGGNSLKATMAQDIDGDRIPELISVDTTYKVNINNLTNPSLNSISVMATYDDITTIVEQKERTFALADIDLDGAIDVVTIVPVHTPSYRLEVRIWNAQTGNLTYSYNVDMVSTATGAIRNSWPFIGDVDGNSYPDIVFMGGLNTKGHTAIYRLEYDKTSGELVEKARNNTYNDYSSMSTSMSMFDFNNDGKQEIIYRDESSLYIINGETLEAEQTVADCHSGTGWEYPVVASLTPSGESVIIMCSGEYTPAWIATGSLRIYGADTASGKKPWMPARKVWNQYSFYQNTIYDDLTIIPNPASLNELLTSTDGKGKTLRPFNGHMLQLGIIQPSTLESVSPVADAIITQVDFGYNTVADKLIIDLDISNVGSASIDPNIPINIYKALNGNLQVIFTKEITDEFKVGDAMTLNLTVDILSQYMPFDSLIIHVADGKYDCNPLNNRHVIYPSDIDGVFYVKKGETGNGSSWRNAVGELSDALQIAKARNIKYPHSVTQLWMAAGSYYGNFEMQENVSIYGGFAGVETDINESRSLENATILDAQNTGRPLTQTQDYTLPTEWRGLTLQNGNVDTEGGGALLKKGSTLSYSIIRNNKTTDSKGGGVYADNTKVINCLIEQNEIASTTQGEGAGVYATNSSIVINNTIVKNAIISQGLAQGGGLYSANSTARNNIIYKNTANAAINNILSQGGVVSTNLANNDDSIDPLFVKFGEGNYRLLPTSPALNVGDNTSITGWDFDIEGKDRIYQNKIVDQGAFEYQGAIIALSEDGYFYVNEAKNGDGSSWEMAVNNLSDALTAAKALNENTPNTITKIWVAKGTYTGNFEMVEGANLHGGFQGIETDFNAIDTVQYKTYIDAQGNGRVLTQKEAFDTPTEWAGLILQNGFETAIDYDVYGGGAYLKKNGILRYSTIKNSKAVATSIHNKVNAYGGGVYMEEGALLENSTIDNNIAEVDNTKPATIAHGVAQGGGVNNVKNRLAYLDVKNNKTITQGNRDGGAIYSSGDVVNNVITKNKGLSTLYLLDNVNAINNTIVGNTATSHTVDGARTASLKNSIVYNNIAPQGDFNAIEYTNYKNLINTNPIFEAGSYKISLTSPARMIGDASYFPTDLDKDMIGALRIITDKKNKKIIDAGAYQTSIKVVSAEAITIEVPFGTDFKDIDFEALISGLLEQGYEFDGVVAWLKGSYNPFLAGDYTLLGDLSNLPEGIFNPENVKGTIVVTVKKNHIADIEGLTINGENWLENLEEAYIIDCDYNSSQMPIIITLPAFASIALEPAIAYTQTGNEVSINLDMLKVGSHLLKASVTSQDGANVKTYTIKIVKHFPFWEIIEQRWNNTFVINNNQETNGNYEFVSYKWYKNDAQIGIKQYYSAGGKRTDLLDEASLYHAEMVDVNGVQYKTCKAHPVLMHSGMKVYPNPVKMGEAISIELPLADSQGGKAIIYSLSGVVIGQKNLSEKLSTINAPASPGMYILKVSINGGASESTRLIVY